MKTIEQITYEDVVALDEVVEGAALLNENADDQLTIETAREVVKALYGLVSE